MKERQGGRERKRDTVERERKKNRKRGRSGREKATEKDRGGRWRKIETGTAVGYNLCWASPTVPETKGDRSEWEKQRDMGGREKDRGWREPQRQSER